MGEGAIGDRKVVGGAEEEDAFAVVSSASSASAPPISPSFSFLSLLDTHGGKEGQYQFLRSRHLYAHAAVGPE